MLLLIGSGVCFRLGLMGQLGALPLLFPGHPTDKPWYAAAWARVQPSPLSPHGMYTLLSTTFSDFTIQLLRPLSC